MSTKDLPEQLGDLPRIGRPATGALLAQGVTTLAQVAQWREADMVALHGVGPSAVRILRSALDEAGLGFRP
ncbi:putative flap endonuclease-1-like 5' DNA nuclease [Agrococcus sp. UYP33]